jgi:hypothetical protein
MKNKGDLIRVGIVLLLCALWLTTTGCSKMDVTGHWKLTLKWGPNASHNGIAPPPTSYVLLFKDGKIFDNNRETGYYVAKPNRIRIRPGKIKILCYGTYIDDNHMEGEISYFPTSERFGTWKAERVAAKR